ncbi:YfhO family protein [Allofournierella sp.]|uniref:YfhO family protein n=1 Tax=Allofournierella sp. TaxID=1940256 RepID=UPI003AB6DA19
MRDDRAAMRGRVQLALCFFLPLLLLAGVYAARGIEPFGTNTLLFGDMGGQYLNFMASYKELFGPGLFYTWHKALGGEALSLNAYYLFSPFNLLLLAFPAAKLSLAVVFITLLKTGAAGLAMGLFLRSLGCRGPVALALAGAYALSGYMAGFAQNLMWLDGVILAPLVVLGLRRLLAGGRPWVYLAALFSAVLTCYYIGWMLCLYSSLYFFLHWLALPNAPGRFRIAARFCVSSTLAGGLAAWMLLPIARALAQGKAQYAMQWSFALNFDPPALLRQFFAGAYPSGTATNQLPLVFCGALPLVLALAFFCRRGPSLGEKLAGAGLLAALLASFLFRTPDLVWHGFQSPSWFPFRYSFLFILTLLELAARGWNALPPLRPRLRRWLPAALAAVLAAELALNSSLALKAFGVPTAAQPAVLDQWQGKVQRLQAADPGFYRVQYPDAPDQNAPFLLGYAGTAHYSSSYSAAAYELLRAVGLAGTSGWVTDGQGVSTAAASLLAVKYQLGGAQRPGWAAAGGAQQNPLALPVAFAAASIPAGRLALDVPFANLEAVYSALLGREAGVFLPLEAGEPRLVGLSVLDGYRYSVDVPATGGSLVFTLTTPASGSLYASFPVYDQYCGAQVLVDGRLVGETLTQSQNGTLFLGQVTTGQRLTVELRSAGEQLALAGWHFAVQRPAALAAACGELAQGGLSVKSWGGGYVKGSITAGPGTTALFTSIPCEEGWRVWVDGQPVQPFKALNSLLAAPLSPGTHTVELRFVPPGLGTGLAISCGSAAALAAWLWLAARRKKRAAAP